MTINFETMNSCCCCWSIGRQTDTMDGRTVSQSFVHRSKSKSLNRTSNTLKLQQLQLKRFKSARTKKKDHNMKWRLIVELAGVAMTIYAPTRRPSLSTSNYVKRSDYNLNFLDGLVTDFCTLGLPDVKS